MYKSDVLRILRANFPDLRSGFGLRSLSLFGSVAREDASESSDVDVLVEFDRSVTLFDLVSLQLRLEKLLRVRKVDVVVKDSVYPALRAGIFRDAIHVG